MAAKFPAQNFKDVKQKDMRPDSQLVSLRVPCLADKAVVPMSAIVEETLLEVQRLVTHLQNASELKDTALAHQLHDDLGGLMGAAVMDLDSVRRVKPALSQNAIERVDRVKRTLEQAIDL